MTIIKAKDYNDMSRKAANILSAQVIMNPDCVLGLATGSTPIGIYKQLVEWYKKGDLDFSRVKTVNLDEYKGLAPTDPQSYRYYMDYHLFNHINIDKDNTYLPDGLARDPEEECRNYNSILQILGGVDLQLLGLGHNGHIGFNEPDSSFGKETHLVQLSESTIKANSRLFENSEDVPRSAYTMGIKSIMHARKIVVVASGEDKAAIVKKAFTGEVTPEVPASILQMHGDVTLVADEAALSQMEL